jgi:hypothetical protein
MIAGHGKPVTHHQFIARAADPDEIDPIGALVFRQFQQLRRITGGDHGLGYDGIVAVDDDIDFIFLEHPDIGRAFIRLGNPEENIRYVGGNHRSTPTI